MTSELKPLRFVGSSLDDLRNFPDEARRAAGFELLLLQRGLLPRDWKPMNSVVPGVSEIRIHVLGEWRVIYVAKIRNAVYVLHAFQKKARKTAHRNIDLLVRDSSNWEGRLLKKITVNSSGNVFVDLGFPQDEAVILQMRSDLMIDLRKFVKSKGQTNAQAALILGLSQSRVSDLLNGKWEKFSLEMLITLATRAGMRVSINLAA